MKCFVQAAAALISMVATILWLLIVAAGLIAAIWVAVVIKAIGALL